MDFSPAARQPVFAARNAPVHFAHGEQIDDFCIIGELGTGAFARVYLAQQVSLQRRVALKVTSQDSHEAKVLSQLDHPHIVRVYDERVLPDRGVRLLYMQYVPGGSLRQISKKIRETPLRNRNGRTLQAAVDSHLNGRGELPLSHGRSSLSELRDWTSVVCWLGSRMADALRYAHSVGVLHRDIKPANVLLAPDCRPLLADFNLSFGRDVAGTTPDDDFGGSLPYMSPEQLEALSGERGVGEITESSDVYSLGILLWELATDTHPIDPETSLDKRRDGIRRMIARRRPGVTDLIEAAKLPESLRQILVRCLAPNPADRMDAAQATRALHLASLPDVSDFMYPPPNRLADLFTRRPATMAFLCGLIPNVAVLGLNVWYNHTFFGLDAADLSRVQLIGNGAMFPLATLALLWYARPVHTAVSRGQSVVVHTPSEQTFLIRRCLRKSAVDWGVILGLWSFTGILFPVLYAFTRPESSLQFSLIIEFFTAQLVHGAVAASLAALALSYVDTRYSLPRLLPSDRTPDIRPQLSLFGRWVDRYSTLLKLAPLLAVMRLSLFDDTHWASVLVLSLFGLACIGFAIAIAPRIGRTLTMLRIAVTPTEELLSGGAPTSS